MGVDLLQVVPSLACLVCDCVAQVCDLFSNFLYCYLVFGPKNLMYYGRDK